MIIDIGDVIYYEGVPHKVIEIENTAGYPDYQTFYFKEILFGGIKPTYTYMTEHSNMYNEIMEKYYKIDNQIMPLSMARDMRIDEILND
jgi:hypothetical protein